MVEEGELIALPVLAAPDGTPLDLELVAAGRPTVVLIGLDGHPRTGAMDRLLETAQALAVRRSSRLIVVVPDWSDAAFGPIGATVAVDSGLRFAHMLGLADVGRRFPRATAAAIVAVNEVGCVTQVETEPAVS